MFLFQHFQRIRQATRIRQLRNTAIAVVAILLIVFVTQAPESPGQAIEVLAWTQLFAAILVGGSLTGWRAAQFPKSRAVEFQLVTPRADWEIVGGELVDGIARATLVLLSTAPAILACWGAGWIGGIEAVSLIAIPLVGGWLAGIVLTMIAYEPLWIRRGLERMVVAAILGYLLLFGLLGHYFLPWVARQWAIWTGTPTSTLADLGALWRYFNPFRLLGSLGQGLESGLAWRVAAVLGLLVAISACAVGRIVHRLRPHYFEENYGRQHHRQEYARPIRDNPLAWWTARRVGRFRGKVNLYLAWTTCGLFAARMVWSDRWPSWLAANQLAFLDEFGGGAMLAAVAVQLAVVPVAFLNGLWESNEAQRVRRFEELLVTELTPGQYLWASVVASWIRGRGYLLGALMIWLAAISTRRIDWPQGLLLMLLTANYLVLSFAVAFRRFASISNDRAVTLHGLVWSVGLPCVTIGLFRCGWESLAAATPLGGIYLIGMPASELSTGFWLIVAVNFLYLAISIALLVEAIRRFDDEVHAWFAEHLVTQPDDSKPRCGKSASIAAAHAA